MLRFATSGGRREAGLRGRWRHRHALAIGAVLLALLLETSIDSWAGPGAAPFLLFFVPVFAGAWYGGLAAGITAAILAGAFSDLIFLSSSFAGPPRYAPLLFFLAEAALVAGAGAVRRARGASRRAAQEGDLERIREHYRLFVEGAKDCAIIMLDEQGRIESWNAGAQRMFGFAAEDIIGRSFAIFHSDEERARGVPQEHLQAARTQERFESTGWRFDKDGRRFRAEVVLTALGDSRCPPECFSLVYRDVTARLQAEEERSRLLSEAQVANAAAQAASRAKDEFLSTLSHELRTPLTSIVGWAEMLRTGSLDSAATERGLELICMSAAQQATLIDDLLDISRIITGKLRLTLCWIRLGSLIQAAVDAVRPAAEGKGVQLHVSLDGSVGMLRGDPDRLQQVIWNLLANAVRFTPRGGEIHVVLERAGSCARVTVRDSGDGIGPEFLPHVFERLRQGDASTTRSHSGLGIGLAIVRHLVELHGGSVEAASPGRGRGATFTVTIPLAEAQIRRNEGGEPDGKEEAGDDSRLVGLRILVVDDDWTSREVLRTLFEQNGAAVTTVGSTAEALQALDHAPHDLLVSDIAMPEQDGYELIRQVRARDREHGGAIRAVGLTAHASEDDRRRVLAAGYEMHIPKPFEPRRLTAGVGRLARAGGVARSSSGREL